jgi:hypothetical protein
MRTAMHFLVALTFMAATAVSAKDSKDAAVNADTREKFQTISAGVKSQMQTGGRYQQVNDAEKSTITQKFDDMNALFAAHATVAEMSKDNQLQLFNDQEAINAILSKRDGERLICKKEAPIGSHIPVTTCHTYAQEQEMHKSATKQMDDWSRSQNGGQH